MASDPELTIATLIQMTAFDYLMKCPITFAPSPELVDIFVVMVGLGVLRSKIEFVESTGRFWDPSQWQMHRQTFLDNRSMAYVCALAAWTRKEKKPKWISSLNPDIKSQVRKSLSYLNKTGDAFFQPEQLNRKIEDYTQSDWLQLVKGHSQTCKVVGLQLIKEPLTPDVESAIIDCLSSSDELIVLHSLGRIPFEFQSDLIVDTLRRLVDHKSDLISSKALLALTDSRQLDSETIEAAGRMLSSRLPHVEYCAIVALSSLESLASDVLEAANQGFIRTLQLCNYGVMDIYLTGFTKWLDDPMGHIEDVLGDHSPEYLRIASESLQSLAQQPDLSDLPVVKR